MQILWEIGKGFVRNIVDRYPELSQQHAQASTPLSLTANNQMIVILSVVEVW